MLILVFLLTSTPNLLKTKTLIYTAMPALLVVNYLGEYNGKLIYLAYSYEKNSSKRLLPIMPKIIKYKSVLNMGIPEMNNLFMLIGYDAYIARQLFYP